MRRALGAPLARARVAPRRGERTTATATTTGTATARHGHGHDHGHHHHHGHTATSTTRTRPDPALSRRRLLGIGISGGIIPCPTALVVLLAAISLHRVGYGLVLIVAFSLGLAATMTGLGLAAVAAPGAFSRVDFGGRAIRCSRP